MVSKNVNLQIFGNSPGEDCPSMSVDKKYQKYTSVELGDQLLSWKYILLLMMDLLQRLKNTNRLQMMISNFLLVLGVNACTVFVVELHIWQGSKESGNRESGNLH